jgi:hypothetical protein
MVGMETPDPGGVLNLKPKAARLVCVTVSEALAAMYGMRALSAAMRCAAAIVFAFPAAMMPRFVCRPMWTASPSVREMGPAGGEDPGTEPCRFPETCVDVLMVSTPAADVLCCTLTPPPGA